MNEGGNLIFTMKGRDAQDEEEIRTLWEHWKNQKTEVVNGICLVTGQREGIARIHRGIKGIPGAQSSGAALVSFNAPAFESYGKEQSYNAPVGVYAESGEEIYQSTFLDYLNPKVDNQDEMKKVFGNLEHRLRVDLDDIQLNFEQNFYILCLAPNAARLSVRFFYQNTFGSILQNLRKHYQRMEIVRKIIECICKKPR